MSFTDTDTAPSIDEVLSNPEAEAPETVESDFGQAETEGTPTEVQYLDVDANSDRFVRVKVNGEELEVPLTEALQGYQRQADYTQKTQELSAYKQEVEVARALYAALETNPQQTVRLLQETYGVAAANQMMQQAEAQAEADAADDWVENDPVAQRLAQFEERFARYERESAERELNETLVGLQQRYGDDFDAHSVVSAAVQYGVTEASQLEAVYKQMAFDRLFAYREAVNETGERTRAEEAAREQAKAALNGTVNNGPSASGSSVAPPSSSATSIAEAWAAARAQLG
jgi:hypothetical protein